MVVTELVGRIPVDRVDDLERAYRDGTVELPPEILETFLVRDTADPMSFRIITVWSSRAALEAMRASGVTPKGVQIFRAAGADPELAVLEVAIHRGSQAAP